MTTQETQASNPGAVTFPNGRTVTTNAKGEPLRSEQVMALEYFAACQRAFRAARAAWTELDSFSLEGKRARATYQTASTAMSNARHYAIEIGAIAKAYWE